MEGLSACSSSASSLSHTASDGKSGSATFYSHSTCEVSVEPSLLNSQDSEYSLKHRVQQKLYSRRVRDSHREIIKKLEDILINKCGTSINICNRTRINLMLVTIHLINQIENKVDPIKLSYDSNYFLKKNCQLNSLIEVNNLTPDQLKNRRKKLLLNKIRDILHVNLTSGNSCIQILSAACDYLNDYLKQNGTLMSSVHDDFENEMGDRDAFAPFSEVNIDHVSVKSTRVNNYYYLKQNKRSKDLRIKNNKLNKELEDILFRKFGVKIISYGRSKNKLIDATIFIIKQIKEQVEPIKLVYGIDYSLERSRHVKSLIKDRGLSIYQISRKKKNLLLNELKSVLDIDTTETIDYEKILSEACKYLNGYLDQKSNSTEEVVEKIEPNYILSHSTLSYSDGDVISVTSSIQPVVPQSLYQSSLPLTVLAEEEELTLAEQSALIRLKNALNRYPIPQINIENFRELLFAAAYCIKMNTNMMQVSELDYNQQYVKHFHAPYPYNNPRDEIEDHLDDLEKALLEESMNSAINQCLNHQKHTLPETGDLENTGLDSFVDTLEPEALFTTGSLNHTVRNREDDSDSTREKKIKAALNLAAQYLENEQYIELQNLPAYEDLIHDEFMPKKIKR